MRDLFAPKGFKPIVSNLSVSGGGVAGVEPPYGAHIRQPKSLFKIWNFGVANAKILPYRLKKSSKIGIFAIY
jgi:hypothetical protein